MPLFSRRDKKATEYRRPPESGVALGTVWGAGAWRIESVLAQPDGTRRRSESDDRGLAQTIAEVLRAGFDDARGGGSDRGSTATLDAELPELGAGDWVEALAAGARPFTVSLSRNGLTVNRLALTAEAPTFRPQLYPAGPDGSGRFADATLANWVDVIDGPDWPTLPVWATVSSWLIGARAADPRAGAWWVPDITDPATPLAPLRESERASIVTRFLNRTEDIPDESGPAALGWADPGRSGRWLTFYEWRPFGGSPDAFPGLIGFVLDGSGAVRLFHWTSRDAVRQLAVDGRAEWPAEKKTPIQHLLRDVVAAGQIPSDWSVAGDGPG